MTTKWKVTYDYYGSNREVPLYTKSHNVHAADEKEAVDTIKKLVGGRNHKAEKINESVSFLEWASKRTPLSGHPYHKKSDSELKYIIKDAGEAARAQKGMPSEGKYLDQVNDASTILYYRKTKSLKEDVAQVAKDNGVSLNQLKKGIEVEKEHTDDVAVATKIALDHLKEKPNYYTALSNMEAGKCDK